MKRVQLPPDCFGTQHGGRDVTRRGLYSDLKESLDSGSLRNP